MSLHLCQINFASFHREFIILLLAQFIHYRLPHYIVEGNKKINAAANIFFTIYGPSFEKETTFVAPGKNTFAAWHS